MSASSSECEYDLNYNNYRTYNPIQPFYPGLGHPMIYYAQVQRTPKPQQSGKTKNNCFIKAFRWYTEEHLPLKKIESGTKNEDIQGFAAWLDQKYEEYIRKSQMTQCASLQYLLKPSSSVRSNKLAQNVVNVKSAPRKNKIKSPWRRRQIYKNKQSGDTIKKSDQSIEFLLNPKNLSRSASELRQKCRRSNDVITVDTNALKSKSESIIYILKEKAIYVVNSDDNDKNCNDDKINVSKEQSKVNKRPTKETSCQYSVVKLERVDASSQFSHKSKICDCVASNTDVVNERINYLNTCCPCIDAEYQDVPAEYQNVPKCTNVPGMNQKVYVPTALSQSPMSQKSICNIHSTAVPRETSFFANKNIGKNERSFSVNGIAQTSDHAINLSNLINPEHPIFLKVICADK